MTLNRDGREHPLPTIGYEVRGMENNDILIKRSVVSSFGDADTRAVFTLHVHPSEERIAGPYDSESVARARALGLARRDGCNVWVEDDTETHGLARVFS